MVVLGGGGVGEGEEPGLVVIVLGRKSSVRDRRGNW